MIVGSTGELPSIPVTHYSAPACSRVSANDQNIKYNIVQIAKSNQRIRLSNFRNMLAENPEFPPLNRSNEHLLFIKMSYILLVWLVVVRPVVLCRPRFLLSLWPSSSRLVPCVMTNDSKRNVELTLFYTEIAKYVGLIAHQKCYYHGRVPNYLTPLELPAGKHWV